MPETVTAEFAATRAYTGTVFELRFHTRLHGPCFRCLADAVLDLPIRAREYQAEKPEGSDELITPYLADELLDLSAWARDALVLALPGQDPLPARLRRPLPGLRARPQRRAARRTRPSEPDTRWAELAKLRDQL